MTTIISGVVVGRGVKVARGVAVGTWVDTAAIGDAVAKSGVKVGGTGDGLVVDVKGTGGQAAVAITVGKEYSERD